MGIYVRAAELESEIARLKTEYEAELAKLRGEIAELQNENGRKDIEIERKDLLIKHYMEQIMIAQHRRFGSSSERTEIPDQFGLYCQGPFRIRFSILTTQTKNTLYYCLEYSNKKTKFSQ